MKKIRKKIMLCLFALMFVLLSCKVYAYNYETTELRVYSLRDGFKLCAESPLMVNSHNLYIWSTFENNNSLQAWPGVPLTQDSGDIYCYTYHKTDDTRYDYVIFNGDSKQTIDLSATADAARDTTKVQKATESVMNTSGGAQLLNSASISGSTC